LIFQARQRIVFIGDSITDAGRRAVEPPYGAGYMSLVRAFVVARHPDLELEWFNRGVNGDTVRDLAARWEADVVALRPDWLSVMIGINDVWRFLAGNEADGVPLEEFERIYRRLLKRAAEAAGCRLILADPYVVEADPAEPHRAMSDLYGRVVGKLAGEFGAAHVRTQVAFDRVLAPTSPADWSHDRIHLDLRGHAVLAQAYLDLLYA
jgi:lysophospholipase L1-like esterase